MIQPTEQDREKAEELVERLREHDADGYDLNIDAAADAIAQAIADAREQGKTDAIMEIMHNYRPDDRRRGARAIKLLTREASAAHASSPRSCSPRSQHSRNERTQHGTGTAGLESTRGGGMGDAPHGRAR